LVCQLFNISDIKIFKEFSSSYKIYREVFDSGQFGLEIRDLSSRLVEDIHQIILEENEICYKKQPENHKNDLFIPGSFNKLKNFARRVISSGNEDIGYRILNTLTSYEQYNKINYKIGGREFVFNKSYVMGILNVTPDSFSDGGLFLNLENAVEHAVEMIDNGSDIIDVGGESTRPGSDPVSVDEEIDRVIPVIKGIIKERPGAVISVDTTKSRVAEEAIAAGAVIVNDISGLSFDDEMITVIKKSKISVIIMHIKGTPRDMQQNPVYDNVVKEVFDYLNEKSSLASKEGIQNIFIDPGIGFGKTVENNIELLRRLDDFKCMGYPIVTGVSRKSFLGKLLDLNVKERDTASAITDSAAVINGARIIRTHNVPYGIYVSKITGKFLE
jgi:dihydropteroate synthase